MKELGVFNDEVKEIVEGLGEDCKKYKIGLKLIGSKYLGKPVEIMPLISATPADIMFEAEEKIIKEEFTIDEKIDAPTDTKFELIDHQSITAYFKDPYDSCLSGTVVKLMAEDGETVDVKVVEKHHRRAKFEDLESCAKYKLSLSTFVADVQDGQVVVKLSQGIELSTHAVHFDYYNPFQLSSFKTVKENEDSIQLAFMKKEFMCPDLLSFDLCRSEDDCTKDYNIIQDGEWTMILFEGLEFCSRYKVRICIVFILILSLLYIVILTLCQSWSECCFTAFSIEVSSYYCY